MWNQSAAPPPPPIIPGVTDTGELPESPLAMLSKMMTAQPQLADQAIRQAIMSLQEAVRLNPALQGVVGRALRVLQGAESQADSAGGIPLGKSGNIVGPVPMPTMMSR